MQGRATKIILAGALAACAGAQAATTVVTADRLLDVLSGKMVERPAVVVVDGRIRAVLSQGAAAIPEDAAHVDLPGQTLLPGLIDMHVHLAADARIDGNHTLDYTDSFWVAVGVANARAMLEAGFTTVRDVGAPDYADVGIKQAVEGGYVPGPRIVPATYALGSTGGHCDTPKACRRASPWCPRRRSPTVLTAFARWCAACTSTAPR